MNKPYYVHAQWDEEAKVWVASSDDVPGLQLRPTLLKPSFKNSKSSFQNFSN